MRFTSFLTVSALFTLSTAADSLLPRLTPTTTTTLPTRATTQDVCALISGPLIVSGAVVGILDPITLCINGLSQFAVTTTIETVLQGLRVGGHDRTVRALRDLIDACEDTNKQTCTYPAHSVAAPTPDNACAYTCQATYTDCGTSCKKVCPTIVLSVPQKRDPNYWGNRMQKTCEGGWMACGISGGGSRDWECVDARHDLVSCGGCASGLVSSLTGVSIGTDCSNLPGVADVSCVAGGCAVRRCLPGFNLAASGKSCEKEDHGPGFNFRDTLQAVVYGLDHIPFK
ncbi:hypothetical protein B0H19DRAFT_1255357 [Mycena capillaripes]|nr:hypothetical protein B0H19DRAFT_1255357 [Mycena capillaripes]